MLFLIIFPNESREDFCCGFPFSSSRKKLSRPNILPFRTKKTSRQTPVSSTARPMTSRSPLSVVAFWDSSSLLRLRRESLYWAAFHIPSCPTRPAFFRQLAPQFRDLPIHKKKHLINELPILTKGDLSRTRSQTAMKMVLEAGPFDIHAAAVTQGKHGTDETHGFP